MSTCAVDKQGMGEGPMMMGGVRNVNVQSGLEGRVPSTENDGLVIEGGRWGRKQKTIALSDGQKCKASGTKRQVTLSEGVTGTKSVGAKMERYRVPRTEKKV